MATLMILLLVFWAFWAILSANLSRWLTWALGFLLLTVALFMIGLEHPSLLTVGG